MITKTPVYTADKIRGIKLTHQASPWMGVAESAARTLEYAYDDWCIMTLGKPEEETAPFQKKDRNPRASVGNIVEF